MDHSDLGPVFNGFRIQFLEPKYYDEAVTILQEYLNPSLIPIGYSSEFADDWETIWRAMVDNEFKLSYIAVHVKTGKIAAVRMMDVVIMDQDRGHLQFKHPQNEKLYAICDQVGKTVNVFEKYGVTKYAEMFGLCVVPEFRKMGLASEMYARGLKMLKKRGFEIVKCGFLSPYSRKAGQKHGYEEFARRYFHDCKDKEGNILNPASDPTDFICFGVFNLQEK